MTTEELIDNLTYVDPALQHYSEPRLGRFRVNKPEGKYICGYGWETIEADYEVIAEDTHLYIREFRKTTMPVWQGDKVIDIEVQIELGIHKSRFIKWLPRQLPLF